jgi:hypothetical protein
VTGLASLLIAVQRVARVAVGAIPLRFSFNEVSALVLCALKPEGNRLLSCCNYLMYMKRCQIEAIKKSTAKGFDPTNRRIIFELLVMIL